MSDAAKTASSAPSSPHYQCQPTGDKLVHVEKLHWHAQHEGHDLQSQVEAYKNRYGHYPKVVIADTLYGSRDNRSYLGRHHVRFSGKPLRR